MTEDEEKIEELEEDESEEDIFFEENLGEEVSDFSISNTILSTANSVMERQMPRLEDIAEKHQVEESQWEESDEFSDEKNQKDFYDSSKDSYDVNGDKDSSSRSGDNNLYTGKSTDLYSETKQSDKLYDPGKKHIKGYDEFTDTRRSGRSMLEVAGFEDKEKQKNRAMRSFIQYEGRND